MKEASWFKSPHTLGKWHLLKRMDRTEAGTPVFVGACHTMLAKDEPDSTPMTTAEPVAAAMCKRCAQSYREELLVRAFAENAGYTKSE